MTTATAEPKQVDNGRKQQDTALSRVPRGELVPRSTETALLDPELFTQMQRIATAMANSPLTPKHLQGRSQQETMANCLRVVNQAFRWGMDPFALLDETYVVHGRLGYQGKLIIAVVNSRSGMRLDYRFNAQSGDGFAVVVFGASEQIDDTAKVEALLAAYAEKEDRAAYNELAALGVKACRLSVKQGKTDNTMWREDPEQKLVYSGATKWARRFVPELMLGVATEDDLDRIRQSRPRLEDADIPREGQVSTADLAEPKAKPRKTKPSASPEPTAEQTPEPTAEPEPAPEATEPTEQPPADETPQLDAYTELKQRLEKAAGDTNALLAVKQAMAARKKQMSADEFAELDEAWKVAYAGAKK